MRPAVPTRQRGASTLEYVAMTVVAALVAVALIVATPSLGFGQTFANAVCTVLQRDSGCTLGQWGEPAPEPTPLERATKGRYVALGDSYSSGEGAWDYTDDTNRENNNCHRSNNAYSQILGRTNTFEGGSTFVACSGAVSGHLEGKNGPKKGDEGPQLDALGDDVSLVTMSMGGNDIDFAGVVTDCMINGARGVSFVEKCRDKHDARINRELPELKKKLIAQYLEIKKRAPNARIVIVGYPQLFEDNPDDNHRNLLFKEDQVWMNEKAAQLNAMLREAAAEAGVEFVDPTNAFRGHGLGSDDPWINDLSFGGPGVSRFDYSASFHPNAAGHEALANEIQRQLERPR